MALVTCHRALLKQNQEGKEWFGPKLSLADFAVDQWLGLVESSNPDALKDQPLLGRSPSLA